MTKWTERPLATLVAVQKGRKVSTFEYRADGCAPYLGAEVISGGSPSEYADPEGAILAEELDVLMLWDGERSGLVGKGRLGIVSSTAARLSPREMIDSGFLFYSLDERFEWIQGRRTGTGVPHVPKDLGRILHLTYPTDLKEQRRIAEILSTVDVAIEGTEKLIAKHQQIKAGLMHDLFTRGLTPDGHLRPPHAEAPHLYKDSPLGPMPKEWETSPCRELCLSVIDCKNRTPPLAPEGHPVVRTPNVRGGAFVWDDLAYTDTTSYLEWTARGTPQPGDIVITREAPVGEVCVLPEELDSPCLGQRMMLYRPDPAKVLNLYLLFALQSREVQQYLDRISGGSTVGHVRVGEIRDLLVPRASIVEQTAIAAALDAADSRLRAMQDEGKKLHELKRGLMHDLLTGEVPVPIPELEDHG